MYAHTECTDTGLKWYVWVGRWVGGWVEGGELRVFRLGVAHTHELLRGVIEAVRIV